MVKSIMAIVMALFIFGFVVLLAADIVERYLLP